MPKIKIVWANAQSRDEYDDAIKLLASSGDWQEVTDEELTFLRKNIYTLQSLRPVHTWVDRVFIVEQESTPMPELIQRLKDRLADLEKQRAADEARQKKAAKERAKKAKENKRKQFEKLKKEFEK